VFQAFLRGFLSSACSGREAPRISKTGFLYWPDVLSAIQSSLSKHWREALTLTVASRHPFFTHYRTLDGKGVVPFTPVVWGWYLIPVKTAWRKIAIELKLAGVCMASGVYCNVATVSAWPACQYSSWSRARVDLARFSTVPSVDSQLRMLTSPTSQCIMQMQLMVTWTLKSRWIPCCWCTVVTAKHMLNFFH